MVQRMVKTCFNKCAGTSVGFSMNSSSMVGRTSCEQPFLLTFFLFSLSLSSSSWCLDDIFYTYYPVRETDSIAENNLAWHPVKTSIWRLGIKYSDLWNNDNQAGCRPTLPKQSIWGRFHPSRATNKIYVENGPYFLFTLVSLEG